MVIRERLMGGTLRTRPMEIAMSCSLMMAFSSSSFWRRVPSFFCCSSNSWITGAVTRPSSMRASAIRSPNVLTGGMGGLPESFTDVFDEFDRCGQIPQQTLAAGGRQLLGRLLVEWVGGYDQHGVAHPIDGEHKPALANCRWKRTRKVDVDIVLLERQ